MKEFNLDNEINVIEINENELLELVGGGARSGSESTRETLERNGIDPEILGFRVW